MLEARGQRDKALKSTTACAAMDSGQNCRAMAAIAQCRERMDRLTKAAVPR